MHKLSKCIGNAPKACPERKITFYRRRAQERSNVLYWTITVACLLWVMGGVWSVRDLWKGTAIFAIVVFLAFLTLSHVQFQAF